MDEHRTDPHAWPVDTVYPAVRAEGAYDVEVVFATEHTEPCIEVCMASGYDRCPISMDAKQAREAAASLLEAADILEATLEGRYVPPASTWAPPPEPKPGDPGYGMHMLNRRLAEALVESLNRTSLLFGEWGKDESQRKTKARRS